MTETKFLLENLYFWFDIELYREFSNEHPATVWSMEERQFASLLKDCGDTNLNLCLSAAEAAMSSAEFDDAERLYRRGLNWSERRFGAQSAAVGLVLMSMIKLYEMDGKNRDTRAMEVRCRQIFKRYFFKAISASMADC